MLEILIKENITTNENAEVMELSEDILSDREQNVVRFVAGYIPNALEKHFKKCELNKKTKDILLLISSLSKKRESQSFLESTNKWIDCSNRGGLFEVSDQAYIFFRSMEYEVRKFFNVKLIVIYNGENLKDILLQRMLKSRRIINNFDEISNKVETEENIKTFVLKKIMIYWINIRGNAFVKAWLDNRKLENKVLSKKGEHSLRKELPS